MAIAERRIWVDSSPAGYWTRELESRRSTPVDSLVVQTGTAHWMFDRGLIGLDDDLKILVSRHVNDAERVRVFINRDGFAAKPLRPADRPHPHLVQWHKEKRFKV